MKLVGMNREQIEAAIERGVPFVLRMADGREYRVPHRDYIFLSPKGTYATVFDADERFFVLPLLTMTGIASGETTMDGAA
jgi:hypothetical protein